MSLYDLLRPLEGQTTEYEFKIPENPGVTVSLFYSKLVSLGEIYYTEGDESIFRVRSDKLGTVIQSLEETLEAQFPWTRGILYPSLPKTALERILADEGLL